jgi:alpha-galactosidase
MKEGLILSEIQVAIAVDLVLKLFFDISPNAVEWKEISPNLYRAGDYLLKMEIEKSEGRAIISFSLSRSDESPFTVNSYGFSCDVPISEIHRVYPFSDWFTPGLPWEVNHATAGNRGIPCLMLLRRDGQNKLTIGFADQVYESQIHGYLRFSGEGLYHIEGKKLFLQSTKLTVKELKDAIYVSIAPRNWFDVAKDYASFVDDFSGYKPNPIPDWAYEPVYCSWYPYEDNINEKIIWENARIAKEVGIGTFLIDAGWNTERSGEWSWIDGRYGDYIPCSSKFPDFKGLIKRMQRELGLKVEVWFAPFWLGSESETYKKGLKEARCKVLEGGKPIDSINLCPQNPLTIKRIEEIVRYFFEELGVDGVWVDFVDSLPWECSAQHEHIYQTIGEGATACLERLYKTATSIRPDAVIEYRIFHGNLNTKRFLNVQETTDTPHNYDDNRRLGVYVRAFAKGVVVKTDPTMWSAKCPPEEVAKHCATMIMGGVPAFSLDLPSLPQSHLKILSAYLSFYKKHRDALLKGNFRPLTALPSFPINIIEGKESFLYIGQEAVPPITIPNDCEELYIFNCTERDTLSFPLEGIEKFKKMVVYNEYLEEIKERALSPKERLFSVSVPLGGMVKLTR